MVKIGAILDEEPEIHDRPGAKPLARLEGDLELDSLVFAYGKDPVLHGVSFHIRRAGASRSSASRATGSRRSPG